MTGKGGDDDDDDDDGGGNGKHTHGKINLLPVLGGFEEFFLQKHLKEGREGGGGKSKFKEW